MKSIKYFFAAVLACAVILATPSCSKDDKDNEPDVPGGSMSGDGDYGKLDASMVATGGTRAVSYTQGILLGTVDFSKLRDTHTFGVVYMESVEVKEGQKPFDYNIDLQYNKSGVVAERVTTTADGKFEKQLVGLMPATTYYYRSYIKIGDTYNYAEVKSFSTLDPSPQISLMTGDAEEVCALSTVFVGRANIGNVNNGLEQAEILDQNYGFIYSDDANLSTAETLTFEYWEDWDNTHFDTQKKPDKPSTIMTKSNMNTVLRELSDNLIPGTTYYYRTVFAWNNRYFYSPEVKRFTTLGPGSISVGTLKAEDITSESAILKGHVPFEKIGKTEVNGGFMISKKYSNRAEFVMHDKMETWPSSDDISYVSSIVTDVDFDQAIYNLESGTEYHICAYIDLGNTKETTDKYGNIVRGEKIYLYGDVISFTTAEEEEEDNDNNYAQINISSDGQYPWSGNNNTGYVSGNAGIDNSESELYIEVFPDVNGTVSFNWSVDSEQNYDKLTITTGRGFSNPVTEEHSGSENGTFTFSVYANQTYRVTVKYSKDGSSHNGSDKATVRNIRFIKS